MMKQAIFSASAPAAIGPYAQAITVGDTVYISGQLPIDPATGSFPSDDVGDQTRMSLENIRAILAAAGLTVSGGTDSPYVWAKTPNGMPSWDFFDLLLQKANVVTTPGAGFGPSGEGYIRLTAFGGAEATMEAVERIKAIL